LIVIVQLLNSTRSSARVNLRECCSQCWTWQDRSCQWTSTCIALTKFLHYC